MYPTEEELQTIREWDVLEQGYRAAFDYIRTLWQYADFGYWTQTGDLYEASTGGWSGNESIIGAMQENFLLWHPFVMHMSGGHYAFDVREWDDNPERGKRVLMRDPATPDFVSMKRDLRR